MFVFSAGSPTHLQVILSSMILKPEGEEGVLFGERFYFCRRHGPVQFWSDFIVTSCLHWGGFAAAAGMNLSSSKSKGHESLLISGSERVAALDGGVLASRGLVHERRVK